MTHDQLESVRKAMAVTVPQFAETLGICPSHLYKLLKGTKKVTPTMAHLVKRVYRDECL